MLKTIFLTASKGIEGKNFEHIMRIIFLSKYSELTMLVSSEANFYRYLSHDSMMVRSPSSGRLCLILFSTFWLFRHRKNLKNAILFTEPSVLGIVGLIAKLFCDIKWIVDVWDIPIRHNFESNYLTKLRIHLTRVLIKFAYKYADLFIVGIRTDLQFSYYKIPPSKIFAWQTTIWIPQTTQKNEYQRGKTEFKILCMKSVHNLSCGLDILLKAFLKIQNKSKNFRLWIIGNILPEVDKLINVYKNVDNVEYLGFIEHNKVMKLIREADLCVIPWYDDVDLAQAYPTKVMEYMTEGKVVLAPKIAAISDMVNDNINGLLFKPNDVNDLADKILYLYNNKELHKRLASNARKYNWKFDTIRKHEAIFQRLHKLSY